jgi:carbamoyltransferase
MVKREVVVLGINDGHDAGAALIKDGNVVAAVQEERLNNIKHYAGIPEKSINEVFKISKIHPSVVSLVAVVSYDPPGQEDLNAFSTKLLLKLGPLLHSKPYIKIYSTYKKLRRNVKGIMNCLEKLELTNAEITIIEHQKAHASAAYRSSPWGYHNHQNKGQTLILTADGSGDGLSSTVNIGTVGEIMRIASSSYYDSLGNAFYTEITRYLGLKPWDHENKVMGLAPYGKASHCIQKMREIINIDKRNPLVFKNRIGCVGIYVQPKLRKLLANQRFDNIAAAAQQHLEELVKSWVLSAVKSTGVKRLALAGGIFLNVKLNKLLRETEDIEEIFIYPAPDDEGNAVGAALEGYFEYCRREGIKPNHVPISQTYYGPTFENEEIKFMLKNRLDNNHWKYDYYDDIDSLAGELLTKGKIIARCSGRLEWGPRALGNRSIIADPRDSGVIHKIISTYSMGEPEPDPTKSEEWYQEKSEFFGELRRACLEPIQRLLEFLFIQSSKVIQLEKDSQIVTRMIVDLNLELMDVFYFKNVLENINSYLENNISDLDSLLKDARFHKYVNESEISPDVINNFLGKIKEFRKQFLADSDKKIEEPHKKSG